MTKQHCASCCREKPVQGGKWIAGKRHNVFKCAQCVEAIRKAKLILTKGE